MTKKKILLFLAVVMLYLTANMSGVLHGLLLMIQKN